METCEAFPLYLSRSVMLSHKRWVAVLLFSRRIRGQGFNYPFLISASIPYRNPFRSFGRRFFFLNSCIIGIHSRVHNVPGIYYPRIMTLERGEVVIGSMRFRWLDLGPKVKS